MLWQEHQGLIGIFEYSLLVILGYCILQQFNDCFYVLGIKFHNLFIHGDEPALVGLLVFKIVGIGLVQLKPVKRQLQQLLIELKDVCAVGCLLV